MERNQWLNQEHPKKSWRSAAIPQTASVTIGNASVYNMQMGAAEISALIKEYTGSYIMTFAGYNAGRGRVQQWVAQRGDPRNPKIDAVDWVERIPLAETRNYGQRVMENLQVYRARFGTSIATTEPNLHRAATIEWRAKPVLIRRTNSQ